MMLGEMLCMLAYIIYINFFTKDEPTAKDQPKPNMFLFLPPALCDVIATSMMYVGLNLTSASQFQMLRGSIMIFVGIFSKIFLKKQMEWFRWVGMAVVFAGEDNVLSSMPNFNASSPQVSSWWAELTSWFRARQAECLMPSSETLSWSVLR